MIKGMEMPRNGLYQIQDGRIHAYRGKGGKTEGYDLIEVPAPHGRLIDADNLVSVIDDEFIDQTRTLSNPIEVLKKAVLCGFAKDVITAAPTIIEAEEADHASL